MGEGVSIGMLETPIQAGDAHRCFFVDPQDRRVDAFRALNGLQSPQAVLSPGRMLVVPHDDAMADVTAAKVGKLSKGLGAVSPVTMSPAQATTFNEDFDLLGLLARSGPTLSFASAEFGGMASYLDTRIKLIERNLAELDTRYRDAMRKGLVLGGDEAKRLRQPIEESLRKQINGIARRHIFENPSRSSLKRNLGLSHKGIATAVSTSGIDDARIKGIERAMAKTSKFASSLKFVGIIGHALNAGAVASQAISDYRTHGAGAATRTVAREAVGFGAGVLATAAATSAVLALGIGTGGVGLVVLGIAVVASGMAGSAAGTTAFDVLTDDKVIGWIVKPFL